jgi:hypothetical protein
MYTPEIARRIWPKERKYHFDFALAVLRRAPLPRARWGDEHYKQVISNSKRHKMFMQFEKLGQKNLTGRNSAATLTGLYTK